MHAPASLDLERSSWSTVVYLNIVKSLRVILEALENASAEDIGTDDEAWPHRYANLKLRLSPLIGMEAGLASRLSDGGGIAMNGGKGGVFVRRGWQTTLRSGSPPGVSNRINVRNGKNGTANTSDDPTARLLLASKVCMIHYVVFILNNQHSPG